MFPRDIEYYRQRAAAERKNLTTANPNVAAIHEELVRLYEGRVEQEERRSSLHIVKPDCVSA